MASERATAREEEKKVLIFFRSSCSRSLRASTSLPSSHSFKISQASQTVSTMEMTCLSWQLFEQGRRLSEGGV